MNSFCFSRKHFAVSRWFAWQTTSSKTYRYFSKTDLEGESGWQFLGDSTTRKATFHSISSRSKTDPKHEIYNTRNPHTTTTKTNKKRQISHRTTNLNHKEANSEQHRRPTGPARGIPYHEARKQKDIKLDEWRRSPQWRHDAPHSDEDALCEWDASRPRRRHPAAQTKSFLCFIHFSSKEGMRVIPPSPSWHMARAYNQLRSPPFPYIGCPNASPSSCMLCFSRLIHSSSSETSEAIMSTDFPAYYGFM